MFYEGTASLPRLLLGKWKALDVMFRTPTTPPAEGK